MKNYTSGSVVAIMSLTILLSGCNQGSKVTERNNASIINDIDGVFTPIGVALLTVTWQSLKAANANPVKSLRYE